MPSSKVPRPSYASVETRRRSILLTLPVDEYGNYPVAFFSGTIVAAVLFAAALARVGRWLAREVPLDGADGMLGA